MIAPRSSLPAAPIEEGPVLLLDIDGVCAPFGLGNPRFDAAVPPRGFRRSHDWTWHPQLTHWLAELEAGFRHIAWISSWRALCASFAVTVRYEPAVTWPALAPDVGPKINGCLYWVGDETPLAVVDDHFCVEPPQKLRDLYERPAPTLVISPDPVIGLGRALVDLLLEFAADPRDPRFASRHPWVMYADPDLRWGAGADLDPRGWPSERGRLRRMRVDEFRHFASAGATPW